ncbi:5'-nucleotidase C-terminal domain-containing protein [Oceanirhabdus sp. W0125-5]|uniref:5'-nucleotidase C-terminal domain-containing protein n=1 Tax=Oceanirhabdus sp. W0125-5 TaxID=2999116 RepID=UPI0022F2FDB6|nr:5'-nucleotidase C-terminal domain-containing protein [Oceanirhabdus sp. W0125-5]WBW96195.1 5'-nucleotidase C-terminal domain-containing protein [Oceanirhabdus sp. W0125-5]
MRTKKWTSFFVALFMLVAFVVPTNAFADTTEPVKIVIGHTNDFHGTMIASKYDGIGIDRIATLVDKLRAENPNFLLLDAGDAIQGPPIATLTKGESVIRAYNLIKYDAMVAGNHDFDFGKERLLELVEVANFPVLSANVKDANGELLLKDYIIKEFEGVKVGIFGVTTPDTAFMTHPKNVEGLTFENQVETAKKMVKELESKVDVIIAVGHIGIEGENNSVDLCKEVEGIDVFIDGHSHTDIVEPVMYGDTLLVQTGEKGNNFGVVELTVENGKVTATAKLIERKEALELEPKAEMVELVETINKENEEITSVVVGKTDVDLDGERAHVRTGETNLGNLIADAMLAATKADIAFTNGGGIRASIKAGDITKGDVVTAFPFGNTVTTKKILGKDIIAALEHGIDSYPQAKGAFPHVAGMTYVFNPAAEAGNRIVEVMVGDAPMDPEKYYIMATSDFLGAGGDGYGMFKAAERVGEFMTQDEALVAFINNDGKAAVEGRIVSLGVYVVKYGDTLGEIAKALGLKSYEELVAVNNGINPNMIFPGDVIAVPAVAKKAEMNTYKVVEGDTLGKIAEMFGTTYEKLAEANGIENANMIFVGDVIEIPYN